MVDISIAQAAKAYANAAKPVAGSAAAGASKGNNFGEMVTDALDTARDHLKSSEAVTQQAAKGEASMADVAAAVSQAEVTLQTVMNIRDTMISSYKQIMQMPV